MSGPHVRPASPFLVAMVTTLLVAIVGVNQVHSTDFVFGGEARRVCKAYKRVCSDGKVCALQTIDWPHTMKFPVCVYRQHKQVKSTICRKAPQPGRCAAKFTRWYYNIHMQACSWFTYSGCGGNKNNFRTFEECTKMCTPPAGDGRGGGGDNSDRDREGRTPERPNETTGSQDIPNVRDGNDVTDDAAVDDENRRRRPVPARAPEVIDLPNDVTVTLSLERELTKIDKNSILVEDSYDNDNDNGNNDDEGNGEDDDDEEREDKIAARLARKLKKKEERRRQRKLDRERRRREKMLKRRERERRKELKREKARKEGKGNKRDGLVIIKGGDSWNSDNRVDVSIPKVDSREEYGRSDNRGRGGDGSNGGDGREFSDAIKRERERISREQLLIKERLHRRKQQQQQQRRDERERTNWRANQNNPRREVVGAVGKGDNSNNVLRNDRVDRRGGNNRNQVRQLTPLELGPYYNSELFPVTPSSPDAFSSLGRYSARRWLIDDRFGVGRERGYRDGGVGESREGRSGRGGGGRSRRRRRRRRRGRRRRRRITTIETRKDGHNDDDIKADNNDDDDDEDDGSGRDLYRRGPPVFLNDSGYNARGGGRSKEALYVRRAAASAAVASSSSSSSAMNGDRRRFMTRSNTYNNNNNNNSPLTRRRTSSSPLTHSSSSSTASDSTKHSGLSGKTRANYDSDNNNDRNDDKRKNGARQLNFFGLLDRDS